MARNIAELTPQELTFCRLRAQGYDQTNAYRQAFNKPRMQAKSVTEAACRLAAKPQVHAMLRELFREAKKSTLLSHAEYLDSLRADHIAAKEAGNWTAAASFQRLIGQALGSLSDTLRVQDDRPDPEVLINRVAGTNPELAVMLRKVLGARAEFDA
jgi:hypothetical protein